MNDRDRPRPPVAPLELPPGVRLFDADGALSREYLLFRGSCCESGCRNCPYGFHRPPTTGDDPPS